MNESSCHRDPIVPKIIQRTMTHRLKKFCFEKFLIDTSRNSQGFLKLYIVLKRLLFSEQIPMDSVPNLTEKDKFLNSCCVAWKRSKSS